jgi:hypothetical protein
LEDGKVGEDTGLLIACPVVALYPVPEVKTAGRYGSGDTVVHVTEDEEGAEEGRDVVDVVDDLAGVPLLYVGVVVLGAEVGGVYGLIAGLGATYALTVLTAPVTALTAPLTAPPIAPIMSQ